MCRHTQFKKRRRQRCGINLRFYQRINRVAKTVRIAERDERLFPAASCQKTHKALHLTAIITKINPVTMDSNKTEPKFGVNGAVLNSETMTDDLRSAYNKQSVRDDLKAQYKPRVWPVSALFLLAFAAFLFGYALSEPTLQNDGLDEFLLKGAALLSLLAAFFWRNVWEKRSKR